ncbi:MAG TPA: DUF2809 domain-containing protein [Acidobacteriaceae bacterium]|nr:DUF2809 domain-containing protein [Acidobacteriaceae bacterium]
MSFFTRRTSAILIVLVTIPLGLLWRHLPLPFFAWKYGGSALWTIALYWSVAALAPQLRSAAVALISVLLSALVELSRLVNQPVLNAFRQTLAGRLILGRYFSLRDIAAYWITIALLFCIDQNMSARKLGR